MRNNILLLMLFCTTEVVVSLDATDEFLKERVMNLPESVVAGTHNTEEGTKWICRKNQMLASISLWQPDFTIFIY